MAVEFNWTNSGLATGTGYSSYTPVSSGFGLSTKNLKSVDDYSQTKQGISTANAAMESAFESDVDSLISYIADGHEDNAMEKFEEMMEYWTNSENSTLYSNLNEKEMKALISAKVEEQTENGESLEELIREYSASGSDTVNTKILNWGRGDDCSREDLLESMCDVKEEKTGFNVVSILACIASPFTAFYNWAFCGNKKR
jgi:hypothetical protein